MSVASARARPLSPWAGAGAAALSGVLLWAASPVLGAGWLAWVALVPAAAVALASPGTRTGRLAVPLAYAVYLELMLVPALPFGLARGQWGDPPPVLVGGSPVLFVALVAIPLFGAALYLLRFGQAPFAGAFGRAGDAVRVAFPALSWTALDLVRVKLDPGGLWGPLFLSQHDGAAAGLAALAGPLLVTFCVVAASYLVALAAVRRRGLLAAALGAAVLAGAVWSEAVGPLGREGGAALRVAAVQPGYDTAEEDREELRWFERGTWDLAALDTIRDLAPLTRAASANGAQLVVWPEASLYVDPRLHPRVRRALARLARSTGAVLIVPYFVPSRDRGATLAVTPDGRLGDPRPKRRPMWFLGESGGGPGAGEPVRAGRLEVGSMLGVDDQDPSVSRHLAAAGARLLASSTHDWRQLAPQHRAFARLAAAGTGAPVVRADWRYGSAIYAAGGHVLADAGGGLRRTALTATVRLREGSAPWTRVGDAFGWGALAGAVLLALGAALAARLPRPRPPSRPGPRHEPAAGSPRRAPPRARRSRPRAGRGRARAW